MSDHHEPNSQQWGPAGSAAPATPIRWDTATADDAGTVHVWNGPGAFEISSPAPESQPESAPASMGRAYASAAQESQPAAAAAPWISAGAAPTAQEVVDDWRNAQSSPPAAPAHLAPSGAKSPAEQPAAPAYDQQPAGPAPAAEDTAPQQAEAPAAEHDYAAPAQSPVAPSYAPPEPAAAEPSAQPAPSAPEPAQPASAGATAYQPTETSPQPQNEPADDALTIGRGRDNSIVLDDMLVSRRHVRITADDDGLVLEDLGSRNGTFVNGRRVERTHLSEGDRIGIGSATFEVRDGWLLNI